MEDLCNNCTNTDTTVIFCRTCSLYEDTAHIYLLFRSMLDKEMVDLVGYADIARFGLMAMFTAFTSLSVDIKENILSNLLVS